MVHSEKPASKDLALDANRVVKLVCNSFGMDEKEIRCKKRGVRNIARDIAIYLLRKHSIRKLNEIAEIFQ